MDARINWFLKSISTYNGLEINYSRYADDITISFNKYIWKFLNKILEIIIDIIEDEWFSVNYEKINILTSWNRQRVTWLIVNNWISIWRWEYRNIRLILFIIKKYWLDEWLNKWNAIYKHKLKKSKDDLINALNWKISFFKMVNQNLWDKLNDIFIWIIKHD